MVIKIAMQAFLVLIIVAMTSGCASIFTNNTKPATFLSDKDLGVAWLSPDGQAIVFSLGSKSVRHLYKVKIDGTGLVSLGDGSARDFDPVFSPDGSKILFCHISDGQGDICVMNADGSNRACLTSGPDHDFEPVYSPDGSKIYFLRAKVFRSYSPIALPAWHEVDIYSMNADGTGLNSITSEKSYGMSSLSINPKGDMLMVLGGGKDNASPIQMIPINDPANKRIILPNLERYRKSTMFGLQKIDYSELRNPQFSPDGTHILFTWPFHEGLYLMDLHTNIAEKIWNRASDKIQFGRIYPRFSNDGRQVIFSTVTSGDQHDIWRSWRSRSEEPELWIVNTDGTGLRTVEVKSGTGSD